MIWTRHLWLPNPGDAHTFVLIKVLSKVRASWALSRPRKKTLTTELNIFFRKVFFDGKQNYKLTKYIAAQFKAGIYTRRLFYGYWGFDTLMPCKDIVVFFESNRTHVQRSFSTTYFNSHNFKNFLEQMLLDLAALFESDNQKCLILLKVFFNTNWWNYSLNPSRCSFMLNTKSQWVLEDGKKFLVPSIT